jgi:putative PIN family toxin of toxin-antitoxin system
LKVLFDTSVVIPMVIDVSLSSRLAERLWEAGGEIILSPGILEETREKLMTSRAVRKWLATEDDDLLAFLDRLRVLCRIAPGILEVQGEVGDDPDDDHILSAALEMEVNYIVSEDHHLLKLETWRGIKIVNRSAMMAELDRREAEETKNPGE